MRLFTTVAILMACVAVHNVIGQYDIENGKRIILYFHMRPDLCIKHVDRVIVPKPKLRFHANQIIWVTE